MYLDLTGLAVFLRQHLWAGDGEDRELGASALEWALIAAVSVVMASVIGVVIYNVVDTKSQNINTCAGKAVNVACTP